MLNSHTNCLFFPFDFLGEMWPGPIMTPWCLWDSAELKLFVLSLLSQSCCFKLLFPVYVCVRMNLDDIMKGLRLHAQRDLKNAFYHYTCNVKLTLDFHLQSECDFFFLCKEYEKQYQARKTQTRKCSNNFFMTVEANVLWWSLSSTLVCTNMPDSQVNHNIIALYQDIHICDHMNPK